MCVCIGMSLNTLLYCQDMPSTYLMGIQQGRGHVAIRNRYDYIPYLVALS